MANRALRTERLQAVVTPKERVMLERLAARRRMSVSDYLRSSALVMAAVDGDAEAIRGLGSAAVSALRDAMTRRPEELLAG